MTRLIQTHTAAFSTQSVPFQHLQDAWKQSNATERDGYLSYLLNEWAKKPNKMQEQLPHLPFVDWNVARKGIPTLWMEMFVIPRALFNLSTPIGQNVWANWWEHRKNTVESVGQSFGEINSLFPIDQVKDRSPSFQRSVVLLEQLPATLTEQCSSDVFNTFSEMLLNIANAHNKTLPAQWNAIAGIVSEAIAPFVLLRTDDASDNLKKWWNAQHDVLHPAQMHLPLNKNAIGLVGRPEYIFGYMIKETVLDALGKMPRSDTTLSSLDRWNKFEQAFWDASKQRWDGLGATQKNVDFFLPSLNNMLSFTYKELDRVCPTAKSYEYRAKVEKIALLASLGAMPWQKSEGEQSKPRRKM